MSHRVPGSVTALLISALACQPAAKTETATMGAASEAAAPAGLSAADEAAVRAVDESWAKAATAGDANAVGALYAGDATVMPPGMAAVKGDAGKFWSDFFGSMNVQAELSTTAVEGRGDLAYATGTYRMTLTPRASRSRSPRSCCGRSCPSRCPTARSWSCPLSGRSSLCTR